MCDRDGCTAEDLHLFHQAPAVKNHTRISFGVKPLSDQHHVVVNEALSGQGDQSPDGLRLYQIRYQLFDFCHWVIHGKVRKSLGSRILLVIFMTAEVGSYCVSLARALVFLLKVRKRYSGL